ncbi:DNA repair protein XRCC4 [Citrus clementina]|uniref:DNA repair protein XRCC4 n=1 Tax=Citrus clementina TaxID=85681 RepID=UPI000CECE988|nr:DNA repair protein XRCC4 [Citrus x clementina]XP_024035046.1 DNA repair protein XRCC4 [Citrus x clementina]XP_024035051.1 DNA repair protein XRCC4 [Citrus x clementina]
MVLPGFFIFFIKFSVPTSYIHVDEVVTKTQSFERLKVEAEKCLAQSERFKNEKLEFESAVYAKFLGVLNSKKSKLRELRDKLSKQAVMGDLQQEEEQSTDKTESFDEGSDDDKSEEEPAKDITSTSKGVPASRARGRKRISRK